ncbi:hypothetical protein M0812_00960 [Anaeramoeba flamelloides]|uniref:Uncharacterized protein n=1 Tax=Anaeramoeba flamelloides TaxID=1746091 RepID=A0AAV8A8Z9_9EUKA|nr:hypothetical protein M0812_00960 [Anaeramoeba flamelloides]
MTTRIQSTPRAHSRLKRIKKEHKLPEKSFFTLSYLKREISPPKLKRSQYGIRSVHGVSSMISAEFIIIPLFLERFVAFGFFSVMCECLLFLLISPLRLLKFLFYILPKSVFHFSFAKGFEWYLVNFLTVTILLLTNLSLFTFDDSQLYHSIRGQSLIKFYVLFSILDIFSKLLTSLGSTLQQTLINRVTQRGEDYYQIKKNKEEKQKVNYNENENKNKNKNENESEKEKEKKKVKEKKEMEFFWFSKRIVGVLFYFIWTLIYCITHSLVFIIQFTTLNVCVNSHDKSWIAFLISHQTTQLKATIFKKFDSEHLFQISCGDSSSRFNMIVSSIIIIVRNALGGPNEFAVQKRAWVALLMILFIQIMIDWVKHYLIIMINHHPLKYYKKFMAIIASDILQKRKSKKKDQKKEIKKKINNTDNDNYNYNSNDKDKDNNNAKNKDRYNFKDNDKKNFVIPIKTKKAQIEKNIKRRIQIECRTGINIIPISSVIVSVIIQSVTNFEIQQRILHLQKSLIEIFAAPFDSAQFLIRTKFPWVIILFILAFCLLISLIDFLLKIYAKNIMNTIPINDKYHCFYYVLRWTLFGKRIPVY